MSDDNAIFPDENPIFEAEEEIFDTLPKTNPNKNVETPSIGRGRGRPKKILGPGAANENNSAAARGSASQTNGGRGRPPKLGAPKLTKPVIATGRGRGRPKSNNTVAVVKAPAPAKATARKKAGRPRKTVVPSDDEDESGSDVEDLDDMPEDEDEEEHRPVGRPPTGAAQLNIVRTGRGQGRPPKKTLIKAAKASAVDPEADGAPPRKRGRPALGGGPAPAYVPTGRGRGRPKAKVEVKKPAPVGSDDDSNNERNDEEMDNLAAA